MNRLTFLLLTIIVSACSISEKEHKESTLQKVDQLLSEKLVNKEFNGNALVAWNDSVFIKSYGYSRFKGELPLERKSVFYLGSLAKQFTGMSIMLLAEENKLDLDDPVTQYIDSLPEFCNEITIRQMLNHTSGLPDYYSLGIFKSGMTNEMVVDAMKTIESLDFEPGTSYKYSNSAYVMLSEIVEVASDTTFGAYLKIKVFDPLDMDYTVVYDESRPMIPFRALGHYRNGNFNDYAAFTTGGGGIFSNLDDLYTWVRALDSGILVSESLMEEAYSPVQLNDSTTSFYGFGWMLDEDHPEIVRHSGSLVGYRTYMYRNMSNGTVIILLSNFTDRVGDITNEILQILNEPV